MSVERIHQIIAVVQECGSDASTIRDAAHEATHAIMCRVPIGSWDRDSIHNAVLRANRREGRSGLVRHELTARAVEMLVCKELGVKYELDQWANIMWWETIKNMMIQLPSDDWCAKAIKLRAKSREAAQMKDAIIALAEVSCPKLKRGGRFIVSPSGDGLSIQAALGRGTSAKPSGSARSSKPRKRSTG